MNVMNVRVTNKRLADVPTNTVPRLRRLRIDRHGRPRPCGEALEREVEDGHSYRVTCARLLKTWHSCGALSLPSQFGSLLPYFRENKPVAN